MMEITAQTLVCASLAKPNRAAIAPAMHNAGFKALGLDYVYVAFEPSDIGQALAGVRALEMRGVSISSPYKEKAVVFMDELDETARAIGAVNTVKNDGGRLVGYNSDWLGAVRALEEKRTVGNQRVALLGAGGAARAIGYGLVQRGAIVTIYNRTAARGESLASAIGARFGGGLEAVAGSDPEILVNATAIGMGSTEDVPVPDSVFNSAGLVMDIVVSPRRTILLERARRRGCTAVEGLRMLVHQGAFAFELFTGEKAPLDAMFSAVEQMLDARQRLEFPVK